MPTLDPAVHRAIDDLRRKQGRPPLTEAEAQEFAAAAEEKRGLDADYPQSEAEALALLAAMRAREAGE